MSEQQIAERGDTVTVDATFRNSDGGRVILRQVALGYQPIVIIEPEVQDDGEVAFKIDCTDLKQDELIGVLELLAETLRNGKDAPR